MPALSKSVVLDNADSITSLPAANRPIRGVIPRHVHTHHAPITPLGLAARGLALTADCDAHCNTRCKLYPGGEVAEILVFSRPVFLRPGTGTVAGGKPLQYDAPDYSMDTASAAMGDIWARERADKDAQNLARSQRRARTAIYDLARCNPMSMMVTLTLNQRKISRYNYDRIIPTLNAWLSNRVQRKGLQYILVPEYHKDGAIHFHGFFNSALELKNSHKKDKQGRPVYNLPDWSLGWTTAVILDSNYTRACRYVCKYIGKSSRKVGGRWYLSGGKLCRPQYVYFNSDFVACTGRRYDIPYTSLSCIFCDI